MSSARQRAALLAPLFGLKPPALTAWLEVELGSTDALDRWTPRAPGIASRAVAPRTIYHLCPGNVPEAGLQSLLIGLLLGSRNVAKLPRDPAVRKAIRAFAASLPAPLRPFLALRTAFRPKEVAGPNIDAVIAYGGDEAVAAVRARLRPDQVFLPYGHRVSLLWLGKLVKTAPGLAAAVAHDVSAHAQLGCLSPQAVYLAPGSDAVAFCEALARALHALPATPPPLAHAAFIRNAKHAVRAAGGRLWESASPLGSTVLLDPDPAFRDGYTHRTVAVRIASPKAVEKALLPFREKISTVGLRAPFSPADEALALALGAERICPVGQCQQPPLFRHHDGRPRLADLVKWVDREVL
ncbi:Acyl-CoA reductase (LuxC) [Verrucomicrobium sp. GAS474]|uniref:acyl-CoA reductase n=1 Tax=Verrucomicrobium sp. GAS474 TaxID=1882831 RepID=UPI00087BC511|nr:acyl-CoA reductase [Verrucomicrobium sp. GAS474]SDU23684.1 Acyl-CoA reductase (LuxC) [Verrucomicrobium sp. GAS474]